MTVSGAGKIQLEAQTVVRSLPDPLDFEAYAVVGSYLRYDPLERESLSDASDQIREALLGGPGHDWPNFILWGLSGQGKTEFAKEIGKALVGRADFRYFNLSENTSEELGNLRRVVMADDAPPTLCLFDEIDDVERGEILYSEIYPILNATTEPGRRLVCLLAGSDREGILSMQSRMEECNKGGDLWTRSPHHVEVPKLTVGDRALIGVASASRRRLEQHGENPNVELLHDVERFAIFYVACQESASTARAAANLGITAVERMSAPEKRLRYKHFFDSTRSEDQYTFRSHHDEVHGLLSGYLRFVRQGESSSGAVPAAGADQKRQSGATRYYAVNPRQYGRPNTTLDRVDAIPAGGNEITGTIHRMLPVQQRQMAWKFSGTRFSDHIFAVFWPLDERDPQSRGSINLTLVGDPKQRVSYVGQLLRRDMIFRTPDIVTLRYGWYERIALIAALDYDNTLRPDYSIIPWLEHLRDQEKWPSASHVLAQVKRQIRRHSAGELPHDTLSSSSARTYAEFMKGRKVAEVEQAARRFIEGGAGRGLRSFAAQLILELCRLGVEVVVVTGAPKEIVSAHLARLRIRDVYALELREWGGVFTGEVATNHGESEVKRRIVESLTGNGRVLILGAGDSESDAPLLEDAHIRLVIGPHEFPEGASGQVIRVTPEDVRDEQVTGTVLSALEKTGVLPASATASRTEEVSGDVALPPR